MSKLPTGENDYSNHPLALRIMDMFQRPSENLDYLNSEQFAKDLFKLCQKVRHVLEGEPRVVYLQSPAYIFGDIHGNLEDLHFFSDNIWRLGMSLTAGNFLFLGDYVDRGMNCLEVTAYLLAMKLQLPNKVFLLRGNHETRDVNGWEEHYGERSFIYQCRNRFGDDIGYRIWEACNQVFDRLPLCGVVDQDIFCVHGGIPRPVGEGTTRIQDILNVSKVAGINPPYEHEDDDYQQVASDCIWSDPASEEQEQYSVDPETGFGESLRGGGAICFGNKAVTEFLAQQGFSYIMRAHEAHAEGVAVSKGARVFTVFSTSKDHNQGSQALAGCILVDGEKLQVINRSPAYKNQYVHRRDSVSLNALSPNEISKRIKLGLISPEDDESSEEDWDDFESSEEESDEEDSQVYTFSQERRRSSVNLHDMAARFNSDEWDSTHTSGYINTSSRHLSPLEDTIEEDEGEEEGEDDDSSTVEAGDIK
jgi:diadenosine tetraphosphatase ApaH/serine/threonine PP2A family protein phosphatase